MPKLYLANAGMNKLQTSVEDVQEIGRITAGDCGMEFTKELNKNENKGKIYSDDLQKVFSKHPEDGEVRPDGLSTLVTVGTPTLKKSIEASQKRSIDFTLSRDEIIASEQALYYLKVLDLNRKDLDYDDVKNHIMLDDPTTFREAMSQVDSAKWIEALAIE